ncbi:RNA methyltransferase [Synechococcus sp. ATX 2A4]|uniref:RNA methyltransferase n=1 Tax=Synechococcus sp. ATX 2A4 TaxID=2823727 RepID=UPI0020CF3157|nr:RNA methyltransferase [Synechococcus sp. ATX 2A4]MCP9885476.1 RNA methyltransferase [Synechococcus sp. ATX 2A4]
MSLPAQLLLSDLLRLRVRCDQGLDHGPGLMGWMHPPVHRLLGWASKPSAFGTRRLVWRLDQLRGLGELEALVLGEPAVTDPATLERLPTLFDAALTGAGGAVLGTVADAAVELRSGRILHYLVSRTDPRLPGTSRWRLTPDRIVDQQPGQVLTGLSGLDDLPLAKASVRQEFLRRSRRWRDQVGQETSRIKDQFQEAGGRFEERLEGWLEEPPWQEPEREGPPWQEADPAWRQPDDDPLDDWDDDDRLEDRDDDRPRAWDPPEEELDRELEPDTDPYRRPQPVSEGPSRRGSRYDNDADPWV